MKKSKRELYVSAQRKIIGSLLADSTDIARVLELISAEDFEEPSYAIIFSAIVELSRNESAISPLSVAEQVQSLGLLKDIGGPSNLQQLYIEGKDSILQAPLHVYARIIKEASAKSKITKMITTSIDDFNDDSGIKASDAVATLQSFFNEQLLKLSDASTITNVSKDFDEYKKLLDERKKISEENMNNAQGLQGIPSLLPSLNKYTTGWLPGKLITVGAKTGVGKSVMAVNCAVAAAQANKTVMFFSLEMEKAELEDRILSSTTGIPIKKLQQGNLDAEEKKVLLAQMRDMEDNEIIIDTEPKITVDGIRARAIKQAQSPKGLDFIIVDYLQLITPVGRFSSRQEAVADMSRNMKLLAKQLQVPIMILVQMNRESKDDKDSSSLPKLDQIRESGAIAQDSDIVILLHRDEALDDTLPHTLVILAKNRGGEAHKTIRTHSNLACSLFREVTRVKDIESLSDDELDESMDDLDLEDFDLEEFEDIELGDL